MTVKIEEHQSCDTRVLETLADLDRSIFPSPLAPEDLEQALTGKRGLLILVAHKDGKPVGYKVGYEFVTSDCYFSLSGGVLQEFRRQGVATALLTRQNEWAKANGYRFIRTHTKNKYREMLVLNIRNGFDVTGVNSHLPEKHHGIILEKEL